MDVALRGAVSIARRLQDPLAELVKIDPKSIGVGQYQHDLPESALSRSLDAVVEDCVNAVGVDVNTASAPLLRRVSGITESLAAQIVAHRDSNGPFRTRTALADVPRLGPKAFEQCAGFLRIRGGDDPLDVSGVHPEAYPVVRRILARAKTDIGSLIGNAPKLKSLPPREFVDERFGLPTVTDILAELEKPGRDPRPAFRTATFAEGVHKLSDLRPGMVLEGQVTNVAAFGAFVDVGVHQDGLVHVSAMSATFVSDPREVVKSGDVVRVKVLEVDEARKRISLTLRLEDEAKAAKPERGPRRDRPGAGPHRAASRARTRRRPAAPTATAATRAVPPRRRTAPWPTRCAARDSPGSSRRGPSAPMMGDADRRRTHGQEQHQRCGAPQEHRQGRQAPAKVPKAIYEAELLRMQTELVEMQEWVKTSGTRLVVVFEGRDAAGKGGTIQRVAEYLNPRVCRIVALPAPTERQRTQWYFQRYVEHLPAAGEIVLFDRSWYNRAGVERVMGFATMPEYQRFLRQCPIFERLLIEDGILLRKYWFSVSDAEQERRFRDRLKDPLKQWKLSPMDLESLTRWEEYSRAKDDMFAATDNPDIPWMVVESEDKRRARLNTIAHLLSSVPWKPVERRELQLPKRPKPTGYVRPPRELFHEVPDHASTLA